MYLPVYQISKNIYVKSFSKYYQKCFEFCFEAKF